MENLYFLTRHGRTFINELWPYLSSDARKLLDSRYQRRIDRDALNDLIADKEQIEAFLKKVGLSDVDNFLFGETLTEEGKCQALSLGRLLSFRKGVSGIFIPTKKGLPIYRNKQTADGIQTAFRNKLVTHPASALTDHLGNYIPSNSEIIPEIVSQINSLASHVLVLNGGVLEGIVNHCGGSLDFFDNCGLVVMRSQGDRLIIEESYKSNDKLV